MLCSTSGQDVTQATAVFREDMIVKAKNTGPHARCPECRRTIPIDSKLRFYRHNITKKGS